MTVYIDKPRWAFGRMVVARMVADTPEELQTMAEEVGMHPRQHRGLLTSGEHFELWKGDRARVMRRGAVQVTRDEVDAMLAKRKESGTWAP